MSGCGSASSADGDRRAAGVQSADRPRGAAGRSIRSRTSSRRARERNGDRVNQDRTQRAPGRLEGAGRKLEAQRLHQRTMFNLEMIKEIGYCHGIGTTRGTSRAESPANRRRRCSTTSRETRSSSSTRAIRRCRRSAACTPETGPARKCWSTRLSSALGARQSPAQLPGMGSARATDCLRERHAGPYELRQAGGVIVKAHDSSHWTGE